MHKAIVVFCLLLLMNSNICIDGSCDIFFYNKCPLPPVTIKVNIAEFCQEAKKHVDCVNRRLENCTEVQEYGPALETLKLTFKVYLTQATSNGCHDLYDQIRIPRRLPRTRRSTTKQPRKRKSKRRRTTSSIEYHCRKQILYDSCGHWNHSLDILNRTVCHQAFRYHQCAAPLKVKCQNMLANDEDTQQIEIFLQKCYKTFLKPSKNRIDCLTSNTLFLLFSLLFTCSIVQQENMLFLFFSLSV